MSVHETEGQSFDLSGALPVSQDRAHSQGLRCALAGRGSPPPGEPPGSRRVLARDDDDEIVDRHLMTLTLSCDHRILYGTDAAQFLSMIRELLEQPLRLAL